MLSFTRSTIERVRHCQFCFRIAISLRALGSAVTERARRTESTISVRYSRCSVAVGIDDETEAEIDDVSECEIVIAHTMTGRQRGHGCRSEERADSLSQIFIKPCQVANRPP